MSNDAKESAFLWMWALIFVGLFWSGMHFDWFHGLSKTWIGTIGGVVGLINVALFVRGLWQRRASNPNNPNGS